jgi:hypothetical protein
MAGVAIGLANRLGIDRMPSQHFDWSQFWVTNLLATPDGNAFPAEHCRLYLLFSLQERKS